MLLVCLTAGFPPEVISDAQSFLQQLESRSRAAQSDRSEVVGGKQQITTPNGFSQKDQDEAAAKRIAAAFARRPAALLCESATVEAFGELLDEIA